MNSNLVSKLPLGWVQLGNKPLLVGKKAEKYLRPLGDEFATISSAEVLGLQSTCSESDLARFHSDRLD
jgi:hypothetical protein